MPIACRTPSRVRFGARNPLKTALLRTTHLDLHGHLPDISESLRYLVAKGAMRYFCANFRCLEMFFPPKRLGDGAAIGLR